MKKALCKLRLRHKIIISFALVLLIQVFQGVSFSHKLAHVNNETTAIVTELQPTLVAAKQVEINLLQISMHLGLYMLDKEQYHLSDFDRDQAMLWKNMAALKQSDVFAEDQEAQTKLESISNQLEKLIGLKPEVMSLVADNGKNILATQYASEEVNPLAMEVSQLLSEMIQVEGEEEATATRKNILMDLNSLRYSWSALINEMRLFLAFRTPAAKQNMQTYKDSVQNLLLKVGDWGEELTFEQSNAVEQLTAKTGQYFQNLEKLISIHESDQWRMDAWTVRNKINPVLALLEKDINSLIERLESTSKASSMMIGELYTLGRNETAYSILVGMILLSLLGWVLLQNIQSQLGSDPKELLQITRSIAAGDLNSRLDIEHPTGVYASVITMQENLRESLDKEHNLAEVNGRVKQALDTVTTNVMITDHKLDIIYMNDVARKNFYQFETAIRNDIPGITAAEVIGSNISMFSKDPEHQRELLTSLTETYESYHKVAGRTLKTLTSPVFADDGARIGTVIEVVDRTEEHVIENEVQDIVNAAKSGDLSQRIDLGNKQDFYERLSSGINEMINVNEQIINDTVATISAMSKGTLTTRIDGDYQGSFGRLKHDVNSTIRKLTEVMEEISRNADRVLCGAQELASGNNDLSTRTERQTASLEEVASSMKEMTLTVRNNAENAAHADKLATNASGLAEQGSQVVNKAMAAMNELTDSSSKIAAIISIIDKIAFQTNLLALNAAVEAARAGEQGRGFAVVASEVRTLAGRSAVAAKEIKELIEDSVLKVEEGSKLVHDSGKTLEKIMASVKQVDHIIDGISTASQQQSNGIEQVNHAILKIDGMARQNSALTEEAAAASMTMGEQAKNLNELVGFFKTGTSRTVYSDKERRQVNRPWSNQADTKTLSTAVQPPATRNTANGTDDGEGWEEV